MGLEATWRIECDHCGKEVKRTLVLSKETISGIRHYESLSSDGKIHMEGRTYYTDIWGPGVPDGWIQQTALERGYPFFFCGKECYRAWLLEEKGPEAMKRFDEAVWVA